MFFFSKKSFAKAPLSLAKEQFKRDYFQNYHFFLTWNNYSKTELSPLNYCFYEDLNVNTFSHSISNAVDLNTSTFFNTYSAEYTLKNENELRILESFFFLRNSSFITFFVTNLIDTPNCFKKIKSMKRRVFELPLLKFINFLTKEGKREKFQILFFKALTSFYTYQYAIPALPAINPNKKTLKKKDSSFKTYNYKWTQLYLTLNNLFHSQQHILNINVKLDQTFEYPINYGNVMYSKGKVISYENYLKNTLYRKLSVVSPVFTFFVHNVDKNVKKYSRGKSGKYSFVWKYIPLYKRAYVAFKLTAKDVKFSNGQTLKNRIFHTLKLLFFEPQKSFIWKSKIFSYNYVFKNYQKTLMQTLKSSK